MKIILHVGFHKTGSTSIQATLANSRASGFRYLTKKPANHSNLLSSAFRFPGVAEPSASPDGIAEFRSLLHAAASDLGDGTLIVSGEVVSVFSEASLQALKAELSSLTSDISVIGYVRPVADYMSSQFQQDLKNRFVPFDSIKTRPYRAQIEALDGVFGRENVCLVPSDREMLQHGDAVRDFCDRIGFPIEPAAIRRNNESIGAEGIALLYIHRKYYTSTDIKRPALERNFIQHLRSAGTGRFKLDGSIVAAANTGSLDDMRAVSERLGYPFEKFLDTSKPGVKSEEELLATVLSEGYQRTALSLVTGRPYKARMGEAELAAVLEKVRLETDHSSGIRSLLSLKRWLKSS